MKLFTRYNRINLLATVSIFLLASLLFYYFLRQVLVSQVDEDLQIEQTEIVAYVSHNQHLPQVEQQPDQQIFYNRAVSISHQNHFKTITAAAGQEDLRQLSFSIHLPDGWYTVTVSKSLEGTDHLTRSVALIALLIILLMLMVSFVVNRLVLRRLWQPFYETLRAIQHFRLKKNEALHLPKSNIDEFELMNTTLQQTTEMAGKDYVLLKEFTENAAHELQTPLAVIRSKLELLMQYNLDEPQSKAVQSALEELKGLVRLNKSLLLLTKIQNNQFSEKELINLKALIVDKLQAFEEILAAKKITLHSAIENVQRTMNEDLANLLISNLVSNAVKHNHPGGKIRIVLNENELRISNTGPAVPLDATRLFTRFYNPAKAENSTGLGLSIVKQICEVYGFTTRYIFQEQYHQFTVFL